MTDRFRSRSLLKSSVLATRVVTMLIALSTIAAVSFAVQSKVNRANQVARAYGVTATPSLAIGGKYLSTVDARTIGNADASPARAPTGQ